ncbi:hypothetical protein JQS35_19005, partial [Alcaligenes faecalis subsp. faecalis]|uniref:hypothetical protein n=1 Tax=Alcaligenes faecalis TaxID=511 RepID=UPI001F47F113
SLATKQTLGYFKIDLLKAGLKLQKISDLPDQMGELFGKRLLVTIKPREDGKGGYNVWIEGLADEIKTPEKELEQKLFGTSNPF